MEQPFFLTTLEVLGTGCVSMRTLWSQFYFGRHVWCVDAKMYGDSTPETGEPFVISAISGLISVSGMQLNIILPCFFFGGWCTCNSQLLLQATMTSQAMTNYSCLCRSARASKSSWIFFPQESLQLGFW